MKAIQIFAALLLVLLCQIPVAQAAQGVDVRAELRDFFDDYLSVYNRRFGQPERSEQFRRELGELVRMPVLQVPPRGEPIAPESVAVLARNFESFVTMLEQRGVTRLEWKDVDLHLLTDNKALANNFAQGIGQDGEIVYETVSLYLLHRDDSGWRISLFSPYSVVNKLQIAPAP